MIASRGAEIHSALGGGCGLPEYNVFYGRTLVYLE